MKKPAKLVAVLPPADAIFLSRREAAALLRVNIQLVDEMIRRDILPAYRPVGRRILIRREDLIKTVLANPIWEARDDQR